MQDHEKDTQRALTAAKAICDGRHPAEHCESVLITLDHVIATILIAAMRNDANKALAMLHGATLPNVEARIKLFANNRRG